MNEKHGIFKYQYSLSSDACYVSIEAKIGEIITLQISEVYGIYCGYSKILIYDNYDGIYELDSFCVRNSSFNDHSAVKFESKSGKMVVIYKDRSDSQSSFFGEYIVKSDLPDPVVFKHQTSLHTVNETNFLFVTKKNLLSVFTRPINSSVWNDPAERFNATRSRFHSSLVLEGRVCVYDSLQVDETVHCFHVVRASLQRTVYETLSRDPVDITPLVGPSLVAVSGLKFLVVGGYKPLTSFPNRNVWAVDLSTGSKEVLNFTLPQDIRVQEKSTVYVEDRLFVVGKTERSFKKESVLVYYDFNSSLFEVFDTEHLTGVDKFYWCEVESYFIAIVVSENETFMFFPLHDYWLNISSVVKINLYVSENLDHSLFYCLVSHSFNLNLKLYYESNSNFWTVFQTEEICLAAKNSFECLNVLGDSCDIYPCVNGGHTCRKKLKPIFDNLNKTFLCDKSKLNDSNFTLANTIQTRPLCKCLGNVNVNCVNCKSVGCSAYNDCTDCNQSPFCQWSVRYNFCEIKSSQKAKSVCASRLLQGFNQSQIVNTTCVECMKHSDCGWMSSPVKGCVPGNLQRPLYHHFKNETGVLRKGGSDEITWKFLRCPLCDECAEGSHDCTENEVCVDEVRGWTCDCKDGYERPSVGESCRPVCSQPCSNGNCTKPDFCGCFHGFYGSSCDLACPCNQNSRCDIVDGKVKCLECENNTAGDRCQLCEKSHIRLNEVCQSCMSLCNRKTDKCSVSSSGAVTCHGCQGNAWGDKCEKCNEGYFSLDGDCKRCRCNNEDNLCNPETGGNCRCVGKTESSIQECAGYNPPPSLKCYELQCNKCKAGYIGEPASGSPCYKWLHTSDQHCFDPDLPGNCYDHRSYDDKKTHVEAGQVVAYALPPKPASKADCRVYVDVWTGVVDVYFVFDPKNYFVVKLNDTGEHVEKVIDLKTTSGLSYKKISYKKSEHMRSMFYHVTMNKKEALIVEGVVGRLVVTRKHTKKDHNGLFYVIVRAKSGGLIQKRSVRQKGASGRIAFRQDEPRLDLFVFFSSFFSLGGILSVLTTSVWKFRRMVNNRRARINHQLQMIPLARRPCRLVYVCIDDNQPQDCCQESEESLLLPGSDDEKPVRNLKGILNKKPKSPDRGEASRVNDSADADEKQQSDDSSEPKSSPAKMVRFASSPNIVHFEVPEVESLKTHCRPVVVQPTSSNLSKGVITYIATLPATNPGESCQKPVVFLSTLASIEREDENAEDLIADEERKKRKKFKFCSRAQSDF